MNHEHPIHYLVTVSRHGHVMHSQLADSSQEAAALAAKFGAAHDAEVEIVEVHDKAETDLTTHTRELVEDLQHEVSDRPV